MSRTQANLVLLFIAIIWGASFTVQKLGAAHLGALTFSAARFALGAAVVAPVAWLEWRRAGGLAARHWPGLIATGMALCGGAVLQQVGIGGTTVTNAGFLTGLYVPLVPLLGLLVQGIRPHPVVWPAAGLSLFGTWLLSGGGALDLAWGDLWVVASALFWACHVILVGRMAMVTGMPTTVALVQFTLAGLVSAALAGALEPVSLGSLRTAWFEIAFVGVLSVGLAFTLQSVAQRYANAADAAVILSAETVFSAVGGMLILGERPDMVGIFGCLAILAAMLAVQLVPQNNEAAR
ncbi:MAG TPA: DMT family transporter [Magnetospirillum sp.]|nr:DMT family transporter [Magnetospirillum sp.]